MTASREVCILCATYNGAPYLAQQIASIQAQSHRRWRLIVRDDGSRDDTVAVVAAFAAADDRISLMQDEQGNQGPAQNFGRLMEHPAARAATCLMFADQDDVWHPDKISRSLAALTAAETAHGKQTPILVHTDLQVVDASLRVIHPSFIKQQRLCPRRQSPLRSLLVRNFATGCTFMFNGPLRALACPLPAQAVMHDWWLALCAAVAGHLEFVPSATMDYRQHAANQVGARGPWATLRRAWAKGSLLVAAQQRYLRAACQAHQLRFRLLERQTPANANAAVLLEQFCRLHNPGLSRIARLYRLYRCGVRYPSALRNLMQLWLPAATVGRWQYQQWLGELESTSSPAGLRPPKSLTKKAETNVGVEPSEGSRSRA